MSGGLEADQPPQMGCISTHVPSLAIPESRHPSPWHEVAHNLSETSILPPPGRRHSTPTPPIPVSIPSTEPELEDDPLSTSQALRNWERLLALPDSDFRRHQLIHPSPIPAPHRPAPKLAAERDKEGHIEYKLKLIDPTPERFERLVTQMMWRLKEGRNEAIYELGLADDGTVIGLSRQEMDASLRTLELMASEVGATVMILKEIVLTGSTSNPPIDSSSVSSSYMSLSSIDSPDGSWIIRRPDLDENGKPRKGSRTLSGTVVDVKKKDWRPRGGYVHKTKNHGKRPIIFGEEELSSESGLDSPVAGPSRSTASSSPNLRKTSSQSLSAESVDGDLFQLDLEDSPSALPPVTTWSRSTRPNRQSRATEEEKAEKERKAEMKRVKSAARREQRRLDLLKGDGMSPMPDRPINPTVAELKLPHQPVRPSSLRLASPDPSPENTFLDSLLNIPLDSLSLSFADVQTVTGDEILSISSPTETEYASPRTNNVGGLDAESPMGTALNGGRFRTPLPGEEMICVEALVVRKVQYEEGNGQWGFGGDDDVWGLGGDDG